MFDEQNEGLMRNINQLGANPINNTNQSYQQLDLKSLAFNLLPSENIIKPSPIFKETALLDSLDDNKLLIEAIKKQSREDYAKRLLFGTTLSSQNNNDNSNINGNVNGRIFSPAPLAYNTPYFPNGGLQPLNFGQIASNQLIIQNLLKNLGGNVMRNLTLPNTSLEKSMINQGTPLQFTFSDLINLNKFNMQNIGSMRLCN